MVPLRSDTIWLVQNGCSFHELRSEDPNQHLKDFLKLVDSLDLDGDNRERTRLRLFQFSFRDQASNWLERLPVGSITTWEDLTTRLLAQFFPPGRTAKLHNDILIFQQHHRESLFEEWTLGGRLRKLSPDKAWATIERVAQYEDEGWNDAFTSEEEMSKRARSTKGHASSSRYETMEEKVHKYDPLHKGVTYRLRGVEREMPLLEFGWRVGLYSERESRDVATLSGLRNAETVNSTHLTHMFWPTIGDGGYNVGNTKVKSIRNPRIKLAYWCITMTITGRKETTNHVTKIDLFYLYCIFGEGVVCNIPYWLARYLKSVRDKSVIFVGMFVTKIARSFGLLTNEMPVTREVTEEGGGDDEEGDGEGGNEGVGGSAVVYQNMSAGEWQVHQAQWMGQQDDRWGSLDTWMKQQDQRAHWMYDHTVRQFQHLSTRDNLEPHLQIDPFPGFEANYPPYGYHGHMPPGYSYRPDPSHDGSS
ncbi:retrotransposon ORF1 [Tanacetum coccineum]